MASQPSKDESSYDLRILGIGQEEEAAYRWLLVHPEAELASLARALSLTTEKTQALLAGLEAKGLATHISDDPPRYVSASPDIAIEALIFQHQKKLQDARFAVRGLRAQAAKARVGEREEQAIEFVTSLEAKRQAVAGLYRATQKEILTLSPPPLRASRLDIPAEEDAPTERQALARGVGYRTIVDNGFLSLPGAVKRVASDIESGEEIRLFPHLPFKMVMADRKIAIMPLVLQEADSPSLLTRLAVFLDALQALFESLWARSLPIAFSDSGDLLVNEDASPFPENADALVSLLAAGLNDKKIAAELGVSTRTVGRRVVELMEALGTHTRFQAGWNAASHLADKKPK